MPQPMNNQAPPPDVAQQQATGAAISNSMQATSPMGGQNQQANNLANGATPDMAMQQRQGLISPEQAQALEHTAMAMMNPLEVLKEQSNTPDEEISLDILSKKQKDKILKSFQNCKKIAKDHYETIVEPAIENRREIYEASAEHYDKVFPQLSESCRWTSKDVKTVCDCVLPGFMEAFTGGEYPLSIKGVNVEDDERAEKIQQLITYQLERKNNYHDFTMSELKTALKENWAIAKIWWKREEEHIPMEMMLDLNDSDGVLALQNGALSGQIDIKKMEELEDAPDLMKVEYEEIKIKNNHPVIEFLPSSEFRYTPDAPELSGCKFVAQRKVVKGDYLKRKELEGIYKNIDKALKDYDEGDTAPTVLDQDNDFERSERENRPSDEDNASKEVELYEAYLSVDYNDDGIMEKLIVHAVGDHLIRVAKNDFDIPPFFPCLAIKDPNAVFNKKESYSELFEQQQDLKTALIRQVIINTAKNNAPRLFVNEQRTDMDALIAGEEVIPTQGNPAEMVFVPPSLPLSGITMDMVQYAQNEIEAQSGSTRYNQGLDSNSLNKTATGVTAIMGAAEKRNKLMARSIAENFFIPIYKFLIKLNQKYLEDEQMVRLTNKNVSIRKEDLDIDYDLIVNVGQGAGTKEAQIQYLMYTLQSMYPQLVAQGIANSKSYYNLCCKLLEQLGLRDVSMYLLDPDSEEAKAAAQEQQQQAINAQAEALKNSLALAAAKVSMPRVTIDLNSLPESVQKDYIYQKLGIETTEREIAEHEELSKK